MLASSSSISRVEISRADRSPSAAINPPFVSPFPAPVRLARLGEQHPVVTERRRLRILHVLEPFQVPVRELAECDSSPQALVRIGLEQGFVGVVFADEIEHASASLSLGQIRGATAASPPAAGSVGLRPGTPERAPGTPERADDRLAAARPLPYQ